MSNTHFHAPKPPDLSDHHDPLDRIVAGSAFTHALSILLCTIIFLALLDVSVGLAFPAPSSPADPPPSTLARYFNYGLSVESKLRRMVGPTDDVSAPIAFAGWLQNPRSNPPFIKLSAPNAQPKLIVAAYGQSFTDHIVNIAQQKLDPSIELHLRIAPAATLSHSFTQYILDASSLKADVVVLGVLASSLPALPTMSHMTWNFEEPSPYTYPLYSLGHDGKSVQSTAPLIGSLADLRAALNDTARLQDFREQLSTNDRFFNRVFFDHSILDSSVVCRLARRGWWHHTRRELIAAVHEPPSGNDASASKVETGFKESSGIPATTQALVRAFAANVRAHGSTPVVLIFNDRGFGDHLWKVLEPTLKADNIPFINSYDIAPSTNESIFLPDGHFIRSVEKQIAEKLVEVIRAEPQ